MISQFVLRLYYGSSSLLIFHDQIMILHSQNKFEQKISKTEKSWEMHAFTIILSQRDMQAHAYDHYIEFYIRSKSSKLIGLL